MKSEHTAHIYYNEYNGSENSRGNGEKGFPCSTLAKVLQVYQRRISMKIC
jgi:hypothetical protein